MASASGPSAQRSAPPEPEPESESQPWEEPAFLANPLSGEDPVSDAELPPPEEPEELPTQDWAPPRDPMEPTDSLESEEPEEAPLDDPWDADDRPMTERDPKGVSDLIGYLGDLSRYLPEDKRRQLQDDTIPLKMERIRHTLSGTTSPNPVTNPWPIKGEAPATTKQKLKVILDRLKEKLAQ